MSVRKRSWTTARGIVKEAWIADYVDQSGKRHIKTFERKKDAHAYASTAHVEVRQGVHTPASTSKTVAEAAELWISHCEAEGLEFGTIKQRREHLELHIRPYIGRVKLSELTAPRVVAFMDQLRDDGRSLSMRKKVLTNLKTLLSYAQARGLVAQNVARSVKLATKGRDDDREMVEGRDMPTKAELRTMMEKAPARWRAFIVTAIFTGMRASELRGLQWGDIDFDHAEIEVRRRMDAWSKSGSPKSRAGRRTIPLAPMVVNALREWKLSYPRPVTGRDDDGKATREEHKPTHLVFPNGEGKAENYQNIVNRFFAPLQVESGIVDANGRAKYGLHALRHAAASLFIEQGWTPKKVQTVIGHASIQMTFDLYGKLFKDGDGDKAAMERVQAALLAG